MKEKKYTTCMICWKIGRIQKECKECKGTGHIEVSLHNIDRKFKSYEEYTKDELYLTILKYIKDNKNLHVENRQLRTKLYKIRELKKKILRGKNE